MGHTPLTNKRVTRIAAKLDAVIYRFVFGVRQPNKYNGASAHCYW